MKLLIGKIALVAIILFAFIQNTEAQQHKHKKNVVTNRKTSKKVIRKTKLNKVPKSRLVYRTPNRKVIRYKTLPAKNLVVVKHKNVKHYYSGGYYYRFHKGHYLRTAPVFGLRMRVLPAGYRIYTWNKWKYFYHNGVYYTAENNEYEVVAPEPGLVIEELPEGAEQVEMEDESYYEYNNVLYQKTENDGGDSYKVAAIIE